MKIYEVSVERLQEIVNAYALSNKDIPNMAIYMISENVYLRVWSKKVKEAKA